LIRAPTHRAPRQSRVSTGTPSELPAAEVVTWLEGVYLNHHVIAHPAQVIVQAALERLAGID